METERVPLSRDPWHRLIRDTYLRTAVLRHNKQCSSSQGGSSSTGSLQEAEQRKKLWERHRTSAFAK